MGFGLALNIMYCDSVTRAEAAYQTKDNCMRAALPFLGCDLIAMALIIAFPTIALWLPAVMC